MRRSLGGRGGRRGMDRRAPSMRSGPRNLRGLAAGIGALFVAALIVGCGPDNIPPNTGVRGEVLIGPTCPVVRLGTECADKPYASELEVQRADGRVFAQVETDASGRFEVALPPGDYILVPKSSQSGGPPYASPVPFTVTQGAWTRLTIQYDSGIR